MAYRFRPVGPLVACRRPFLLATGRAPAAGLTFLCFAKEKISKRKASQRPCPCGVPCATRAVRGRAQTRYAQTSARPDPVAAALLSTANGLGGPRVLVRCAHLAHACWRAARALAVVVAPAAAAPCTNPLTTTATFPNLGKQARTATYRTNTTVRRKKQNWLFKPPFTPRGGEGAGGKRGTKNSPIGKNPK